MQDKKRLKTIGYEEIKVKNIYSSYIQSWVSNDMNRSKKLTATRSKS
jgi:hypothetical protein